MHDQPCDHDGHGLTSVVHRAYHNAVVNKVTGERDAALAQARRLSVRLQRTEAALGHVVEVLDRLKPCGHDGDEESGEHDPDCPLCAWEAALAHAEAVAEEKREP